MSLHIEREREKPRERQTERQRHRETQRQVYFKELTRTNEGWQVRNLQGRWQAEDPGKS